MSEENVDFSAPTTSTTKVYYVLDDNVDRTPFTLTFSAASDSITFKDFKDAFASKNQNTKYANKEYQYHCTAFEPEMGCDVKVALTDDRSYLKKNKKGIIIVHLSGVEYGTLSRAGTLPRRGAQDPQKQQRRRSAELDGYGGSYPVPPSSRGTVVSRRAGEHLAELYTSTSEDPYRFDESSKISGMSSSVYEPIPAHRGEQVRRRKPRKERFRKAYVPSTIGSRSESSMSQELEHIVQVELNMKIAPNLGFSVASMDGNIFISYIFPGGAAAMCGLVEVGDQILQVNNQSFQQLSEGEAVNLLKRVAAAKRNIVMYIAKTQTKGGYDPLSDLASETMPLDISLWVQSAAHCAAVDRVKREAGADESQQTFDDGTLGPPGETDDEEERQLYDQRRNGIPRYIMEEAERRRENEQNEQALERLSINMDLLLVARAMARPNSGLQIKNRKWLKILVPHSFIGADLVTWLVEKVQGLPDRKTARLYANTLLEKGLIGHVVNKNSFTEKCYYVFGEMVVGRGESSQNSGGTLRAEATTEVTYVGSPAPGGMPGIRQTRNPLQSIPNPLADQTWPISPITVLDKTTRGLRRRDCESIITEDYASMVGVDSSLSYNVGIQNGYTRRPPPNTPLSGGSTFLSNIAPPHPSPCETEFEDDDKRRILTK